MLAQTLVLNYVRKPKHIEALWFASIANTILWWTFVKACFNTVLASTALGALCMLCTPLMLPPFSQQTALEVSFVRTSFALLTVHLSCPCHLAPGIGKCASECRAICEC